MYKSIKCSECGEGCSEEELFAIDDKLVCRNCIFGDMPAVTIYPIGIVRNPQNRNESNFGLHQKSRFSRIELLPSQEFFMYKLEDETHLTVVYYLHETRPVKSTFRRGLDGKKVGVFASRTPDRLSRIGIQDVRLVKVEGTTLVVEGIDAIDSTPVLDIKMCLHRD